MADSSQSLARSIVTGFVYPFVLLVAGLLLAAWLTPIVVPLWDANERVPNVYKQPVDVGRAALEAAGFKNLSFREVCSSSVPRRYIREIVVKNGANAQEETSLVNRFISDINTPVLDISKSTPLEIKYGNGDPC